jgi:hypothetical protein
MGARVSVAWQRFYNTHEIARNNQSKFFPARQSRPDGASADARPRPPSPGDPSPRTCAPGPLCPGTPPRCPRTRVLGPLRPGGRPSPVAADARPWPFDGNDKTPLGQALFVKEHLKEDGRDVREAMDWVVKLIKEVSANTPILPNHINMLFSEEDSDIHSFVMMVRLFMHTS